MLKRLFPNITPIVEIIVWINLMVFVASYVVGYTMNIDLNKVLGLWYFGLPPFHWYQVITCMFCHGGIGHIFFNMFSLISIGSFLEYLFGAKRFVAFYFLCGLFGAALTLMNQARITHNLLGTWIPGVEDFGALPAQVLSVSVGASGAIYGVFAALALLRPNVEFMIFFIPFPIKAKYLLPGMIAIEMFLAVQNYDWDIMGHFAHIGGAFMGAFLVKGLRWGDDTYPRR